MAGLVPFNRRTPDLLSSTFDDFYNMLDDFFTDNWPFRRSLAADTFKIDVLEDDKNYYIAAELPGVKKEEINVTIDEGRLQISVNREENVEEEGKNYIHRERRHTSMQRNIFLADASDEGVVAKLENGVLNITVPKKEKPDKSVPIEIE
ncbi:MAG: Hsp20 family protein [Tepidanaerobacter acetatoxydans]|uniref:Hsp20/alpha crystallin family protein n=1 Tax=Tepidanaerobacter acetatoxydans TaxID=499229 RepID=UPI0026EF43AC|nr:Hsp20 family protein [Tepidanaerobacter acetatoxydans]NLU10728.1 Hsp20 family protein [Tepidanaerobacter acetatoxydans]